MLIVSIKTDSESYWTIEVQYKTKNYKVPFDIIGNVLQYENDVVVICKETGEEVSDNIIYNFERQIPSSNMDNLILDDEKYMTFKTIHLNCTGDQRILLDGDVDKTMASILSYATTYGVEVYTVKAPHLSFPINRTVPNGDNRFQNISDHQRILQAAIGKYCF